MKWKSDLPGWKCTIISCLLGIFMITWSNVCYGKLTSVESHLVKQTFLCDPCVYIQTQRPQSELFPPHMCEKKRYVSMEEKRMCSSDFLEVQGQKHKLFLPDNISWNRSFRHMNYHEPLSRNLKVGKLQFNYGLFSYFRVLGCHRSLPCRLEAQTCPRTA